MSWVALKMLTGDRAKYLGIIFGVAFATLLMTQQVSIFMGIMTRTANQIVDVRDAEIWVMDNKVRFIDEVDNPAVKANIDVSHLELSHTQPEELRRLKGKAIHVHISDCDGKVHGDLPPGRGVVNFGPYLREIKNLGIDGAISIELEYSPDPGKIVDWVREAYRETDKLLQQAGLRG